MNWEYIKRYPRIILQYLFQIHECIALCIGWYLQKEHHLDDCLLLNSFGRVADAISSNVFWVKGSTYYTTPITDGAIDGVLRRKIVQLIKDNDMKFYETSILPDELLQADEVFLTNAGWGSNPLPDSAKKVRHHSNKASVSTVDAAYFRINLQHIFGFTRFAIE